MTAVTFAPYALAICTASDPTPGRADDQDGLPRLHVALVADGPQGRDAGDGRAAACSKVRLAGFGTRSSAWAIASSANEPFAVPITSSPGRMPVTFAPTASTVPATSQPSTWASVAEPDRETRHVRHPGHQVPTSGPQPAACTRDEHLLLRRSPALSMSRNSRTSAEPYRSCTIAFIQIPSPASHAGVLMCTPYTSMGGEYVYGVHLSIR